MGLGEGIALQPLWIKVWVYWMVAVNLASVAFVYRRVEARWVLGLFLGNAIFMSWLNEVQGFTRLLGLSHVLFWTPLLVYLFRRIPEIEGRSPYGAYLRILFATNAVSLVLDYIDVLRYLLGERAPLI